MPFVENGAVARGGSQPGVGDYLKAELGNAPQTITNDAFRDIVFDEGVIDSLGDSITLDSDNNKVFAVAYTGNYSITLVNDFHTTDTSGRRGAAFFLPSPTGLTYISGAPGDADKANESNIMATWIGPLTAGQTFKCEAGVFGAADDVDLDFAQVTICHLT